MFSSDAQWQTDLAKDTEAANADEGVAVLKPGRKDSKKYRVALVSPHDGSKRWISDDFANSDQKNPPQVGETFANGKNWIVVVTHAKDGGTQISSYAPQGSGDRRTPSSSVSISAEDAKGAKVDIRSQGVTVSGGETTQKYAPETGELSKYDGPGQLQGVWGDGYVVSKPGDKIGYGYSVDGKSAWESTTQKPDDVSDDAQGEVKATGESVLISEWPGDDDKKIVAVQDIRTGKVLAQTDKTSEATLKTAEGSDVDLSDDGSWAMWGPYVFGLKGGKSSVLNLHGGTVATIHDGLVYVQDANKKLTTDNVKDKPGKDKNTKAGDHDAVVDAATGEVMKPEDPDSVPLFVSDTSQGVFVVDKGGKSKLYSVPMN